MFYNTVSIGAAALSLQGPGSSFPSLQGPRGRGLPRHPGELKPGHHHGRPEFDGQQAIEATDDSISDAGKVGVWTRADSVTLFDGSTYGGKKPMSSLRRRRVQRTSAGLRHLNNCC